MKKIKNFVEDQLGHNVDLDSISNPKINTGNLLSDMLENLSNGHTELAEQQMHDYMVDQSRRIYDSMLKNDSSI